MGHTPSAAGTSWKKFRKISGKTPETLSERFLEFPSRVRLGCPKPYNLRHLKLPEHFQNSFLPPVRLGTPLFSELVPERASQSWSSTSQQYWGRFWTKAKGFWRARRQLRSCHINWGTNLGHNALEILSEPWHAQSSELNWSSFLGTGDFIHANAKRHILWTQGTWTQAPALSLDGPNRQSPIASVQRTRSTLAVHSADPHGTNTIPTNGNRAIRIAVQRTQGLRGPNSVFLGGDNMTANER